MQKLIQVAERVLALNTLDLLRALVEDARFRELCIALNTEEQLYNQGVDSEGNRLRSAITGLEDYTLFTLAIKESKGQKTDHVTLKDTGEFYESFRIVLEGTTIRIYADHIKDGESLIDTWGPVVGLTPESLQIVIGYARDFARKYVKAKILGNG